MEIILKRIAKRATYTIGRLYILPDGSVERELIPGRRRDDKRTVRCKVDESLLTTEHYLCDTLEPTWRNLLGIPLAPRELYRKTSQRFRGTPADIPPLPGTVRPIRGQPGRGRR